MYSRFRMTLRAILCSLVFLCMSMQLGARHLSLLGNDPDWNQLDSGHNQVSESEFVELLDSIYLSTAVAEDWFRFAGDSAWIRTGSRSPNHYYRLGLRVEGKEPSMSDYWRASGWQGTREQPLSGLTIALDPGHIGGDWSQVEQRHFRPEGETFVVKEAEINLMVAELAKDLLEQSGARILLTRDHNAPVTDIRPEDLMPVAEQEMARRGPNPSEASIRSLANLLFYRVAELQARATALEDQKIHLALSIHFNALPEFSGTQRLSDEPEHLHFLVNGSYLPSELALDNVRFELVQRLVQRYDRVEIPVAESFARVFSERTELPAFSYSGPNARPVGDSGYVWARNLLANRIFPCPVIYLEPYAMNGRRTYHRLAAGDFEGTRMIEGRQEVSIFQEYAEMIRDSLVAYFYGLLEYDSRR